MFKSRQKNSVWLKRAPSMFKIFWFRLSIYDARYILFKTALGKSRNTA